MGVEHELSDPKAVLEALAEFDRLGREPFSKSTASDVLDDFRSSQRPSIRCEGNHWCSPWLPVP